MLLKKTKIWLISFIFLLSQIGSPFLFASSSQTHNSQSPKCWPNAPVCLQTPNSLNLYLEFQQKAIALLASDPFKTTTEQIQTWEWGIFTNKVLKLSSPDANTNIPILTDLLKELETAVTNMIIGTATTSALFLLSALNTESDGLMSFLILFQERPLVRDRSKLQDIDRSISETIYTLGQKWKIWKTIENTSQLQAIITQYQNQGLLSKAENIPSQFSYLELLLELQSLNVEIKSFLSSSSTYQLTDNENILKFDTKRVQNLKSDYHCARFNAVNLAAPKCWGSANALLANLKTLTSNTKKTGASSLHTITSALERLNESLKGFKHFRSKKNKSLTNDELELLRSVYGLDTTKLTDEQLSSFSPFSISQRSKNQWNQAKKDAQTELKKIWQFRSDSIKSYKDSIKKAKEEKKAKEAEHARQQEAIKKRNEKIQEEEKADNKALSELKKQALELQIKNEYHISLHEHLYKDFKILVDAENKVKTETDLTNPTLNTYQFAHLSYQIQKIADLIWNNNAWIRKSLKTVCSYQCSNKPSSTCYIP